MASTQGNPADFFQHPVPLGSNLYDRDRPRATPPEGRQIGFGGQPNSLPTTGTPAEPETPEKVGKEDKEEWHEWMDDQMTESKEGMNE